MREDHFTNHPDFAGALGKAVLRSGDDNELLLGSLWTDQPAALIFVRHFGCIGCSENVSLLAPRLPELVQLGFRVAIIGCGAPLFIQGFRERNRLLHLPIEVFSDEKLESYQQLRLAYGFRYGLGPRGVYEMAKAFIQGHRSSDLQGDPRQQAGALLIDQEGMVHFYHRNESLGDHVSPSALIEAALTLRAKLNQGAALKTSVGEV